MLHGGGRHELQVMATLQGHYARVLRLDGAGARSEKEAAEVLGLGGPLRAVSVTVHKPLAADAAGAGDVAVTVRRHLGGPFA